MKKLTLILFLFVRSLWAQTASTDQDYLRIMEAALTDSLQITRSTDFNKDLKTYFSSEEFKKDFRDKKWGGDLNVVIDSVPIGLKANSSTQQIDDFTKKVQQSKNLKINDSSAFSLFQRTGREDVINRINEYFRIKYGSGFVTDVSDSGDKVTVSVTYRKKFSGDPLPKVHSYYVLGGTQVTAPLVINRDIPEQFIISFMRAPTEDASVVVNTSRELLFVPVQASDTAFQDSSPVGTILASALDFQQFSIATKNHARNPAGATWASRYSKWAPADGREVPNSKFSTIASLTNVPDLRGKFLRGLNEFDISTTQPPVAATHGDTETGRKVLSFQNSEIEAHHHEFSDSSASGLPGSEGALARGDRGGYGRLTEVPDKTKTAGGKETRPRNIAIYYYIRIN